VCMFSRLLQSGALVQPFAAEITLGGYWLTRLQSRTETPVMQQFARWLLNTAAA
ncbi:LysR family transcriptional regulator, partial [Salmonella enterica subsp. enterica serovar Virchow]|nr:LysR family transcriptional regulator [Salmonella enterica subsp. enterica serovar Virchow]